MGFQTLRSLIRPLSRAISAHSRAPFTQSPASSLFQSNFLSPKPNQNQYLQYPFAQFISRSVHLESLSSIAARPFDPLTDTRFPKRRPSDKPRRKRSSLRPPGGFLFFLLFDWLIYWVVAFMFNCGLFELKFSFGMNVVFYQCYIGFWLVFGREFRHGFCKELNIIANVSVLGSNVWSFALMAVGCFS